MNYLTERYRQDWERKSINTCYMYKTKILKNMKRRIGITVFFVLLCFTLSFNVDAATYYVNSSSGNDSWDGLYETYTSDNHGPWETISKLNDSSFNPGDYILFKRGEVFRGQLISNSGSSSGRVTYGAYGDLLLPKPQLLGSKEKNNTSDWEDQGGNIWSTISPLGASTGTGDELLSNPSFSTNTIGWTFWSQPPVVASAGRDTTVYDSSPAGFSVTFSDPGTESYHAQLFTKDISVTNEKWYLLTFRAKCTANFYTWVNFHKKTNLEQYYSHIIGNSLDITNTWKTYKILFQANVTASDGRITLYLGDVPDDATFSIDTVSFKEDENIDLGEAWGFDVGNIIFDNGESCGVKKWDAADLQDYEDYWYDTINSVVMVYSENNPANEYSDIELALTRNIISQENKSYINYENLTLSYGSAHGVGGFGNSNITVRDCDISFIGGGLQYWIDDFPVRYGNGIEFWNDAHDIIVERCRIWDCYDQAYTNQGFSGEQYNIYVRNNVFWNCHLGFSIWLEGANTSMHDVYIENNTGINAGGEWSYAQRLGSRAVLFGFRDIPDTLSNIYFRNNIGYNSTEQVFMLVDDSSAITVDGNCWYQDAASGVLVNYENYNVIASLFSGYQTNTGKDVNSVIVDPKFVDMTNLDLLLRADSPLIDIGLDPHSGVLIDFDGVPRPQGATFDIGAYEYKDHINRGLISYWKLDETSAGSVIDSCGDNDGTNSGATINQTGQVNTAYSFDDSVREDVSIPNINCEEISLSAWFYRESKDTILADGIFGGWYWNSNGQLQEGYDLRFYIDSDVLEFRIVTQNDLGVRSINAAIYDLGTSTDKWVHVIGTYDKVTGNQTLYVDGVSVNVAYHPAGNTIVPLEAYTSMRIGRSRTNVGYFDGKIDEVKIWNRPLTSDEAAYEYNLVP